MGFNAGDGINYRKHPSSLSDSIRSLTSDTNVGTPGRFIEQVDGLLDVWTTPMFSESPTLRGPTLVNRLWLEFYCDINTAVTDPRARLNVKLFVLFC